MALLLFHTDFKSSPASYPLSTDPSSNDPIVGLIAPYISSNQCSECTELWKLKAVNRELGKLFASQVGERQGREHISVELI